MQTHLNTDFHNHTCYSHDSMQKPEKLIQLARKQGLDRIVITDHNDIQGALIAQQLDPELVIVGEEVKTTCGEFLAAFVKELVPGDLTPKETLKLLKDQGAFISVSHPFDRYRGWQLPDLMEIIPYVDAIEIFNSRCVYDEDNKKAQKFALENSLHGTVGSDAHFSFEVGHGRMILPAFTDADELRLVISEGKLEVKLSSPGVHFFTTYAKLVRKIQGKSTINDCP